VLGAEHRLTLRPEPVPDLRPPGSFTLRGHAVGGMGAMAANRVMATTVAEAFGLEVQAYPQFGAEKRGLPTTYFLTAGPQRLRLHCQSDRVDFVAIHDPLALRDPRTLDGLSRRGFLFVATLAGGPAETWEALPRQVRERALRDKLTVMALNVAMAVPELRMQGMAFLGVFLRYAPFRAALAPGEDALRAAVERALAGQFASKGRPVVDANLEGARRGFEGVWELMREGERV
jgi:pyruvate-ferredoxin/flavodoxin oxidoreductase